MNLISGKTVNGPFLGGHGSSRCRISGSGFQMAPLWDNLEYTLASSMTIAEVEIV